MKITAKIRNTPAEHAIQVATDGNVKPLAIAPKAAGRGSSVNGGELLMAALATCFCNDVFREAARRSIAVDTVDVEAESEFGGEGAAALSIHYHVRISGDADAAVLRELVHHTDSVAEIQNTLRSALGVRLAGVRVGEEG